MVIEVNNLTSFRISSCFLKNTVTKIFKELKKKSSVSLVIVSPKTIQKLNKLYRRKNKVTSVLSFPWRSSKKDNFAEKEKDFLGEIVLCYQAIKKEAKSQGKSDQEFLRELLVHSILHLLGFKHQKKADWLRMQRKEKEILKSL